MDKIFTNCDKCGKDIKIGNAYMTILRNIEQAEHSIATDKTAIQVIDSNEILTLCGSCGNSFDADTIAKIILAIPTDNAKNNN